MISRRFTVGLGLSVAFLSVAPAAALADSTILNASYDVSRELYKDIDPAFSAAWKKTSGEDVSVKQSHGGSTKQAQAVAEGLEADVVTLNQPTDLDFLAKKGVISADWRKQFPHDAAPYTTTSIFLVRKGNPKAIKDWDDLIKSGTSVVIPEPEDIGERPLYVFGGVGLCEREIRVRRQSPRLRCKGFRKRSGLRWRRPWCDHDLHTARHR